MSIVICLIKLLLILYPLVIVVILQLKSRLNFLEELVVQVTILSFYILFFLRKQCLPFHHLACLVSRWRNLNRVKVLLPYHHRRRRRHLEVNSACKLRLPPHDPLSPKVAATKTQCLETTHHNPRLE